MQDSIFLNSCSNLLATFRPTLTQARAHTCKPVHMMHTRIAYVYRPFGVFEFALPVASLSLIGHERDTFLLVQCFSFPPVRQVLLLLRIVPRKHGYDLPLGTGANTLATNR